MPVWNPIYLRKALGRFHLGSKAYDCQHCLSSRRLGANFFEYKLSLPAEELIYPQKALWKTAPWIKTRDCISRTINIHGRLQPRQCCSWYIYIERLIWYDWQNRQSICDFSHILFIWTQNLYLSLGLYVTFDHIKKICQYIIKEVFNTITWKTLWCIDHY